MYEGWEMDVHTKIYNRLLSYTVQNGMGTANIDAYRKSDVPSTFPFILVDLLPAVEQGMDLEGKTVNGGLFTFQIDVYDNNDYPTKAKKIMGDITQIMKGLRFEVIAMPSFERQDKLHRCTARFRRMIGADDNYMSM